MIWKVLVIVLVVGTRDVLARPQITLGYKPDRPFYAGSKPIGVPDQLVPPQVPEDTPSIENDTSSTANTLKSTTVIENRVQTESTILENGTTNDMSSSTTISSASLGISTSTTEISTDLMESSTLISGGTEITSGTAGITSSTTEIPVISSSESGTVTSEMPEISLSTSKITTMVLPSGTEAVTQAVPHSTTISDILYTSASKDKPHVNDKVPETSTLSTTTTDFSSTTSSTTKIPLTDCNCKRQEIVITIKHVHEYPPQGADKVVPPKWPIMTQSVLPQFDLFWDKWGAAPTITTNHKQHRHYGYYRPPY